MKKWLIFLALVLSFGLVLAACGDEKVPQRIRLKSRQKSGKESAKEPSKE